MLHEYCCKKVLAGRDDDSREPSSNRAASQPMSRNSGRRKGRSIAAGDSDG